MIISITYFLILNASSLYFLELEFKYSSVKLSIILILIENEAFSKGPVVVFSTAVVVVLFKSSVVVVVDEDIGTGVVEGTKAFFKLN